MPSYLGETVTMLGGVSVQQPPPNGTTIGDRLGASVPDYVKVRKASTSLPELESEMAKASSSYDRPGIYVEKVTKQLHIKTPF